MNNEAIAVKCSLHGPQIVRQRQSSTTHAYVPIIAFRGKEVGIFITSYVILFTNARSPVSVNSKVCLITIVYGIALSVVPHTSYCTYIQYSTIYHCSMRYTSYCIYSTIYHCSMRYTSYCIYSTIYHCSMRYTSYCIYRYNIQYITAA